MGGPFDRFGREAPFAPFFRDRVAVEGARAGGRRVAGTVRACVLDMGFDDPLADGAAQAARRVVEVTVRRADWFEPDPPRTGDEVTLESGAVFSVLSVAAADGLAGWTLKARSKA